MKKILIVERVEFWLLYYKFVLKDFKFLTARTIKEADRLLEENPDTDAVVIDVDIYASSYILRGMPAMSPGIRWIKKISGKFRGVIIGVSLDYEVLKFLGANQSIGASKEDLPRVLMGAFQNLEKHAGNIAEEVLGYEEKE